MRILVLNQYFPPDPAPTGILFNEVAEALEARGHHVQFLDAGQRYREGQKHSGRMVRELSALFGMLWRGVLARRPDLVISGTSPPCLAFVAHSIARRHQARSIHWCMDLYPEIAVALGEIKPGLLPRTISAMMGRSYRQASTVVALDEDMAKRLRRYGVNVEIIRPWVTRGHILSSHPSPVRGPWSWLYSGNLGRAHEWLTILEAQAILEREGADIRLVFQGGGPSWAMAQRKAEAMGLRNVEWRPYTPEGELRASLLAAECLIVSQRPEVSGMLWPSKLALLLALPRPIIFIGPPDGDIARSLNALRHEGVFAPGNAREVANWLINLRAGARSVKSEAVINADEHRATSILKWVSICEGSPPTKVG